MTDFELTDKFTDEDWAEIEALEKKEPTIKLRFCYDCPTDGVTVAEIEVTEVEDFENLWEEFAEYCSEENVKGAAMATFPFPGPPELAKYNDPEDIASMVHNAPADVYDPLTVATVKGFWRQWVLNWELLSGWPQS